MVVTFIAGLMIGIALMAVIGVTSEDREYRAAARRGRRTVRRRRPAGGRGGPADPARRRVTAK